MNYFPSLAPQILDAGKVDYRDCFERKDLVRRLKDTKDFIPPLAKQLLQNILRGQEDAELSSLSLEAPAAVEGIDHRFLTY